MTIVEYNGYDDIVVQFNDKYKCKVHSKMCHFNSGNIKNPYTPNVYGRGCIGNKYVCKINGKETKEYKEWHSMLMRCFDQKLKEYRATYEDVICCEDWLLFDNFYEWIHQQENYNKVKELSWAVDKDILYKGNKIYSPKTCCIVPEYVNGLFIKKQASRGEYPIGACLDKNSNRFRSTCSNPFIKKYVSIGYYQTPKNAFDAYKKYKENIICEMAKREYIIGTITEDCYKAMLNYQVEITD